MARITANGVDIEYESFGSEEAPAVLLIVGLGQQLTQLPESLCQMLVAQGYRVLRFDNRDAGLSTHFDAAGLPNVKRVMLAKTFGLRPRTPYTLLDMAADAAALLDGLGIASAHLAGASMGGMIAQLAAAHYPDKVLSLTSIMSTTGNRRVGRPSPKAAKALLLPSAAPGDIHSIVERGMKIRKVFNGSGYPLDEEQLRRSLAGAAQRAYNPAGVARQLAASLACGDRRNLLRKLKIPATVVHGEEDPLIPLECGLETAYNIPGARLVTIPGLGHEFPEAAMPIFADAIHSAAQRATPP